MHANPTTFVLKPYTRYRIEKCTVSLEYRKMHHLATVLKLFIWCIPQDPQTRIGSTALQPVYVGMYTYMLVYYVKRIPYHHIHHPAHTLIHDFLTTTLNTCHD